MDEFSISRLELKMSILRSRKRNLDASSRMYTEGSNSGLWQPHGSAWGGQMAWGCTGIKQSDSKRQNEHGSRGLKEEHGRIATCSCRLPDRDHRMRGHVIPDFS